MPHKYDKYMDAYKEQVKKDQAKPGIYNVEDLVYWPDGDDEIDETEFMETAERERLRAFAQETLQIIADGSYHNNGRTVHLPALDYTKTIVLDREALSAICEDRDSLLQCAPTFSTEYILVEGDSFDASMGMAETGLPLVMNFANALHPGGGFLNGAKAQEEALCRSSTLYASLSSPSAAVMYQHNNAHLNPLDSDYMLLSPHVCVFRDCLGHLLEKPFLVSVLTIPAPNRNRRARDVPQQELDTVMTSRLEKMIKTAAYRQYRTLVLGAWGCGAFGHDARRVAGYFKKILVEQGNARLFERIIFAILDAPDHKKIKAFADTFRNELGDNVFIDGDDQPASSQLFASGVTNRQMSGVYSQK